MEIAALILGILGYPFVAAWLVGIGRQNRLAALEKEVGALRAKIQASMPRPPPSSLPDAVVRAEPQAPPDPDASEEAWKREWAIEAAENAAWAREQRWEDADARTQVAVDDVAAQLPDLPIEATPATAAPQAPAAKAPPVATEAAHGGTEPPTPTPPGWMTAAMGWLFTGNLVAKFGLVILFIGVGFLLKYVAETVVVPVEVRVAAIVVATLCMLGWGWRLRTSRRGIGLPLQGTAIAILMLVVFGAYQRYGLIPPAFAFALLFALTFFTCVLAVLQDAAWLAAFGITGGFASPLLLSAGEGQRVAVFSYYALLNAGVFLLAIKRSWRPLNLIGFAFTFVIGTAWGGLHYAPADYLAAQLFLCLFFLFYVGIAVAYARQQHTRLKHYVDATLVLGTPLLAFGLQVGLVKDKPFGLALSALALGGFYLTLAIFMWRRSREPSRVLVETFAALGVIFGTLAIPFALDGRWTSGMWALEGVGFVWFGLRRQQRLAWMFGVLLQAGAWMGFIGAATGLDPETAKTSNLWLGFLLLAGSAFAMARGFRQHSSTDAPGLSRIANCSLVIAAVWLLGGAWAEALLHTSGNLLANSLAAGALFTAALLFLSGARLAWPLARRLAFAVQLAGALALMLVSATGSQWTSVGENDAGKPLLGIVMISIAAIATSLLIRRMPDPQASPRLSIAFLLWGGAWWFGPTLAIAAERLLFVAPASLGPDSARWLAIYAFGVAMSAVSCALLPPRMGWTQLRWLGAASWGTLALFTFPILVGLYGIRTLPEPGIWVAMALLWASSEFILLRWTADNAQLNGVVLRSVHAVRTGGPWLALWPVGAILIGQWLAGPGEALDAARQEDWAIGTAWGNYVPTWAMMAILAWLAKRSLAAAWPVAPLEQWYRNIVLPCGALFLLTLATVWNLVQDGTMTPLPYLPLLNPLDLTTGFTLFLCLGIARAWVGGKEGVDTLLRRVHIGSLVAAYVWFNLILLRSAAQFRAIPYQFEELAASQFVQAMLSIVWCASAMVLMRFAARRVLQRSWCVGAIVLGVVVFKLFTVDLASSGSLARVVSFVCVGLLMVLIGYFAPFPKTDKGIGPVPQNA